MKNTLFLVIFLIGCGGSGQLQVGLDGGSDAVTSPDMVGCGCSTGRTQCIDGQCVSCGKDNEACCPDVGNECLHNWYACRTEIKVCEECGVKDGPCCGVGANSTCSGGLSCVKSGSDQQGVCK